MNTLVKMLKDIGGNSVPPRVVAEKIYEVATDGTDRLRYPATPDAAALLESVRMKATISLSMGLKSSSDYN